VDAAHPGHVTSELADVREDWQRLALDCGNVFSTWEWADCWRQTLAAGGEISLTVLRDPAGEPVALLPLHVAQRFGLRVARFIGHGPADLLGPVCAPAHSKRAAAELLGHARNALDGRGIVIAERLGGEENMAEATGIPRLRREPSPVLSLGGSFQDFLGAQSRNFRSQARRYERRLEREHGLRYRLTEDPERLQEDLRILLALHAARWGEKSGSFVGPREEFHRAFASRALEAGWLRLWTMELRGVPVAAWYGFRFGGVETYYQAGRHPLYEELRVGFVLLLHTIRRAFEDGMQEYRFGLGGEEYKSRFTQADPGLDTLALGLGLPGRAAVAVSRAGLRMPPARRAQLREVLGAFQPRRR
jgi:CelD/BcsL family acetyltransferase involved in cellulose biosynthesis